MIKYICDWCGQEDDAGFMHQYKVKIKEKNLITGRYSNKIIICDYCKREIIKKSKEYRDQDKKYESFWHEKWQQYYSLRGDNNNDAE